MPAPRAMQAPSIFIVLCTLFLAALSASAPALFAQAEPPPASPSSVTPQPPAHPVVESAPATPIAIVPLDQDVPGSAAEVTGALQVHNGRAFITTDGTITAGNHTTHVTLPYRGTLLVCASTTVKLTADSSVPAGDPPGLLIAMGSGAVEMSFATTRNADFLLTPDFRILIAGPGAAEVKVRLGDAGDTCVDNVGLNAPYVLVNSLFDTGVYRVQPGQRVMFQHGDIHSVLDQEKEPCGCPPSAAKTSGNEFPLAQSEGLAPTPAIAPAPKQPLGNVAQTGPPLIYSGPTAKSKSAQIPETPAPQPPIASAAAAPPPVPQKKKPGIFTRIGRLLKRIFGAE